jgi:hypothetical protein
VEKLLFDATYCYGAGLEAESRELAEGLGWGSRSVGSYAKQDRTRRTRNHVATERAARNRTKDGTEERSIRLGTRGYGVSDGARRIGRELGRQDGSGAWARDRIAWNKTRETRAAVEADGENKTKGQSCIVGKTNKRCVKKKAKRRKCKPFIYMTSSSRHCETMSSNPKPSALIEMYSKC